ncbi:MAG: hypothetical protein ACE5Z5_12910 [Candidatus Bathyarchaeia archaeon]
MSLKKSDTLGFVEGVEPRRGVEEEAAADIWSFWEGHVEVLEAPRQRGVGDADVKAVRWGVSQVLSATDDLALAEAVFRGVGSLCYALADALRSISSEG